jgi:hypothetical protein
MDRDLKNETWLKKVEIVYPLLLKLNAVKFTFKMRWFLPVQVAPNLHSSKQVSSWLAVPGIVEKMETLKLKRLFQMSKALSGGKPVVPTTEVENFKFSTGITEAKTIPMGISENAIRLPPSLNVHF